MTKTFRGKRSFFGNQTTVTCNDKPLDLHLDLADHSPMGFEWGYNGSGPKQLALAMLAEAFTDDEALEYYEQFMYDVITPLNDRKWEMTSSDIQSWYEQTTGRVRLSQTDITAHAAMTWDKLRSKGFIRKDHAEQLGSGNWDKDGEIMLAIFKKEFILLPEVQHLFRFLGRKLPYIPNGLERITSELKPEYFNAMGIRDKALVLFGDTAGDIVGNGVIRYYNEINEDYFTDQIGIFCDLLDAKRHYDYLKGNDIFEGITIGERRQKIADYLGGINRLRYDDPLNIQAYEYFEAREKKATYEIDEQTNIVKHACKELGITQKELADKLGVSKPSVERWAQGETPEQAANQINLLLENTAMKKELEELRNAIKTIMKYS